jgi:hypothetical protein
MHEACPFTTVSHRRSAGSSDALPGERGVGSVDARHRPTHPVSRLVPRECVTRILPTSDTPDMGQPLHRVSWGGVSCLRRP